MVKFVNQREEQERKERLYDQLVRITTEKAGHKIGDKSRPYYFMIDGWDITVRIGLINTQGIYSSNERDTSDNYKESLGYKLACMFEEDTGEIFDFILSKKDDLEKLMEKEMIKEMMEDS